MRLLLLDCTIDRDSWGSPELVRYFSSPGVEVHVRRPPQDDLPKFKENSFQALVISGSRTSAMDQSPWVLKLDEFVRKWVAKKNPFLGVCYGHQTLVRAIDGVDAVRRGAQGEFGWSEIELTGTPSSLFEGVPRKFHTFSSHFEEAAKLPSDFQLLARSSACDIQACQLRGAPVFGIQFHPEKDLEYAEKAFAWRKKQKSPGPLLHPQRSKELYQPEIAQQIFGNFLKTAQNI